MKRTTTKRVIIAAAALTLGAGLVSNPVGPAAAAGSCGPSAGETVCLSVPDGPLAGDVTVSATRSGSKASGTMEFYLDGAYLNFEYQRPYSFVWPTGKEVDGDHTLTVRLHLGATMGAMVSQQVTLDNGNLTAADIPRSPADYESLFQPQGGQWIAGVGNLGAEKPDELALESYIESTSPTVFLDLGEVHEYGTWATTLDHYGRASFDARYGVGDKWGRMAAYTLATPGNHQRYYYDVFQDYWHERPFWSTEVVNGIRVYDITSECGHLGGCGAKAPQAKWLAAQLAANTEPCVLAMWHRPMVSMDSKRSGPTMATAWSMLANAGGDLVVNADTRDMEESLPMDASLATGRAGSHMVELVSGAGAARWVTSGSSSPKIAWRLYKVPGAVWVQQATDPDTGASRWRGSSATRPGGCSGRAPWAVRNELPHPAV
jgi:hypothetical protein